MSGPREAEYADLYTACAGYGFGARQHGGPGRNDVVYQQNMAVFQLFGAADGKDVSDIGPTLVFRKPGLAGIG
mgnify:CR=1 FL=1